MRKLKGFTLVEILIVIVIIGILIGALVPRMQSAQGRARDVARKNDLSQLQAAIVTSFQDRGRRPAVDGCAAGTGCDISMIEGEVLAAGMNGVPKDPLSSNSVIGLGATGGLGQYRYITVESYGTPKGAFVLMAKTEVEGGSNWVTCEVAPNVSCPGEVQLGDDQCDPGCISEMVITPSGPKYYCNTPANDKQGYINTGDDVSQLKPCSSLNKIDGDGCSNNKSGGSCSYSNESQLRYILIN